MQARDRSQGGVVKATRRDSARCQVRCISRHGLPVRLFGARHQRVLQRCHPRAQRIVAGRRADHHGTGGGKRTRRCCACEAIGHRRLACRGWMTAWCWPVSSPGACRAWRVKTSRPKRCRGDQQGASLRRNTDHDIGPSGRVAGTGDQARRHSAEPVVRPGEAGKIRTARARAGIRVVRSLMISGPACRSLETAMCLRSQIGASHRLDPASVVGAAAGQRRRW
jgi:hypothetical protein